MLVSTALLALGALPYAYANAQYGSPNDASSSAAPSATVAASPSIHTVAVGQNGLTFTPNVTKAAVGELVEFQFYPPNHTVTQSSFESPCEPLSASSFFSGFMVTSSTPDKQTFTINVTSTDPIWFYCAQTLPGPHCALGMVGAINPPTSGNTLSAYAEAAANTNSSGAQPSAQGGVSATPTSAAPAAATSTGAAALMGVSSGTGVVGALGGLFAALLL